MLTCCGANAPRMVALAHRALGLSMQGSIPSNGSGSWASCSATGDQHAAWETALPPGSNPSTIYNHGTVQHIRPSPLASKGDSPAFLQHPENLAGHQATCTFIAQQQMRDPTSRLASSSSSNLFSSAAAASFCAMSHCLQRQAGMVFAGSLAAGSGPVSGSPAGSRCPTSPDDARCYLLQPRLQGKRPSLLTADVVHRHPSRT